MTRHVSAEALARYRQGDVSPRKAARIRAHLAGCRRCAGLGEDLAGVTTMLASVTAPPIPEHLSARIHAALASEAAQRATADATVAGPRHEAARGVPRERPRRLPRLSSPVAVRTLAAAAAVALLAGGGYALTRIGASPGAKAPASAAGRAAPKASGPLIFGPVQHYRRAGHQASFTPVRSSTDFRPGTLKQQVGAELARSSRAMAGQGVPVMSGLPSTHAAPGRAPVAFGNMSDLDGCVNRIAAGNQVLLVDVARYQGSPATVIVTATAGGPEQAWVVGAGCSASRSDIVAHVILPS